MAFSAPTRADIQQFMGTDAPDANRFWVDFGVIPGVTDGQASKRLASMVQQINVPGFSNEAFSIITYGLTFNFRGRFMIEGDVSITFAEAGKFDTYKILKKYHDFIVDQKTGNSKDYKNVYAISPSVYAFDTTGKVIAQWKLVNFFLTQVPDLQFDGTSSQAVTWGCTAKIDTIEFML